MKILTLFGTRPEIIRLSLIIKSLDEAADHVLVHNGQNFDDSLSGSFLRDLQVRAPDIHLGIESTSFSDQIGKILKGVDATLEEERPDRVRILGDTNSGLAAMMAARRGIPVYHLEAGNRCYDDRVPEEINRRVIDHCSTVLMPYTHRSAANLVREGIARARIFVVGNPISQVMLAYDEEIQKSNVMESLSITEGEYFLVTAHRAENVDDPDSLKQIVDAWDGITEAWNQPVLVSVHPRTSDKLTRFGITPQSDMVRLLDPLSFFDFGKLQRNARCVLTDSGTVQEECCILHIPNVTVRHTTERPETVECGSNVLSGLDPSKVIDSVEIVLGRPTNWKPPAEYLATNVVETVTGVVLGHRE